MNAPSQTEALDASRDTIRQRSSQIVLIEDSQGLGTGTFVGRDGLILTNKHVAPSLGPYRVILADGKDVRGVGVHQSPHHDLAVVKIAASVGSCLDVETEVADEYVVGEEVFALGHPRGCRFSVARGIISNPHREFEKEYYVQTDVSINPGNSGGPLVDRSGKLVGIVTMMLSNSQGLGFAVPGHIAADYVRHVRRLLRANVVRVPEDLLSHPEPHRESAQEVVRRAVGSIVLAGRGAIEEEKADLGLYKLAHKGAIVEISVAEGLFSARAQVSVLGPSERQNAAFLAKLLELSGSKEVGGATFAVRENILYAGLSRRAAGLDLEEAVWAIDLLGHLGVEAPPKIAALLFESARDVRPAPPAAGPAPGQAPYPAPGYTPPPVAGAPLYGGAAGFGAPLQPPPVAPPPPAAPQGDPGYPILQMPPVTGWK